VELPTLPLTAHVVDADVQPLTTVSPAVVHVYDNVPEPPMAVIEYAYVCPASMSATAVRGDVIIGAGLTVNADKVVGYDPPVPSDWSPIVTLTV
jgi:hypothetical protein